MLTITTTRNQILIQKNNAVTQSYAKNELMYCFDDTLLFLKTKSGDTLYSESFAEGITLNGGLITPVNAAQKMEALFRIITEDNYEEIESLKNTKANIAAVRRILNLEEIAPGMNIRGAVISFNGYGTPDFVNSGALKFGEGKNFYSIFAESGEIYAEMGDDSIPIYAQYGGWLHQQPITITNDHDCFVFSNTLSDSIKKDGGAGWAFNRASIDFTNKIDVIDTWQRLEQLKAPHNNKFYGLRNGGIEEIKFKAESEITVTEITEHFEIPTNADVAVFMFSRKDDPLKPLIKIHGYDNSGGSDDLVIKAALGYGDNYGSVDNPLCMTVKENGQYVVKEITASKEMDSHQSTFTIPNRIQEFTYEYFLHLGDNDKLSYYIDTKGVVHFFDSDNTPIDNFCNSSYDVLINGEVLDKRTISAIKFGKSYEGVTSIGGYFLAFFETLTSVDLSSLSNVTSIGDLFLAFCISLPSVDLSSLRKVTSIGLAFFSDNMLLTSIDLSSFSNVTSIGSVFLYYNLSLTSIQIGSIDWSTKNVGYMLDNVPNKSTSTLYADRLELAEKFKAKVGGAISNWKVVIN